MHMGIVFVQPVRVEFITVTNAVIEIEKKFLPNEFPMVFFVHYFDTCMNVFPLQFPFLRSGD